uniref:CSON004264 protein n=1 Tax=Culicoides sonorensis TaxID=179676 RepID=A0A336N170_CULSO
MLTEKCFHVISRITPKQDNTETCSCGDNLQHIPFYSIMNNVYLCNGNIATEILRYHKFTHLINIDREYFLHNEQLTQIRERIQGDEAEPMIDVHDPAVEFETLDLNFGHPYSMTVLPNLYRAVKFLEKALENSGRVLIGDTIGSEKAATILIAFIMYKFRLKFVESYQIIRRVCTIPLVLDTFLIAQLMEYEPILETQRRTLLGSSCSSEIRSSRLKRKKNILLDQLRLSSNTTSTDSFNNNNNNNINDTADNLHEKPNNLDKIEINYHASFWTDFNSSPIEDNNNHVNPQTVVADQQKMET